MTKFESYLDKIKLNTELLFYILPFTFILGYWKLSSYVILFLFCFYLKDVILLHIDRFYIFNKINWLLLLIWGMYIVSKTTNLSTGLYYYIGIILIPFLLFTLIHNIDIRFQNYIAFFNILFFTGIVLSLFSYYYLVLNDFNINLRIGSLWDNLNILSAYYLILFMFCLSFIINKVNNKYKIFYYITIIMLGISIFLTQTRGVWLGLMFSLILFFIKKPRIFIIACIVFSLFILFFGDVIVSRFLTIKNFSEDLSSLGRLQAWIATIALLKENLFFGYGFDAFMELRDKAYSLYLVPVIHSHNTYLRSLLEMGLIGSIIYFTFYFKALFYSIKNKKNHNNVVVNTLYDGIKLSLIALLVTFIFEPYFSLFGCSTIVIWLIISISYKLKSMNINYTI